jgi:crotonobetainyl-CoA:carnitine CoA-transferase CaiB-like acyl-CoA transferase
MNRERARWASGSDENPTPEGPLRDLRVLDLGSVIAGPACARYLADFGADVVKVEPPGVGDPARRLQVVPEVDGSSQLWSLLGRNKRCLTLDLKRDDDRARFLDLAQRADVVVENFRPGVLERLGVGPDVLLDRNPTLVVTRITGFGQDGPYAGRPGFATLAEAMSGYASLSGEVGGPPLLPPIALTDEIAGLVGAFATLVALRSDVGQVVDISLLESMFQMMGPLVSSYLLTGYQQPRLGSGIPYSVPRGVWQCADGRWLAISGSADRAALRVLDAVGLGHRPELMTFEGRRERRGEIDDHLQKWIGSRDQAEVLRVFEEHDAPIAPVLSMADIVEDPHYEARQAIIDVEGIPMQGLVARLSATPGRVRWAGRALGADDGGMIWGIPMRDAQPT